MNPQEQTTSSSTNAPSVATLSVIPQLKKVLPIRCTYKVLLDSYLHEGKVYPTGRPQERLVFRKKLIKNTMSMQCHSMPNQGNSRKNLKSLRAVSLSSNKHFDIAPIYMTKLKISEAALAQNATPSTSTSETFRWSITRMKNLRDVSIDVNSGCYSSLEAIEHLSKLETLEIVYNNDYYYSDLNFLLRSSKLQNLTIQFSAVQSSPLMQEKKISMAKMILEQAHISSFTVKIVDKINNANLLRTLYNALKATTIPKWRLLLQVDSVGFKDLLRSDFPFGKLTSVTANLYSFYNVYLALDDHSIRKYDGVLDRSIHLDLVGVLSADIRPLLNKCSSLQHVHLIRSYCPPGSGFPKSFSWVNNIQHLTITENYCQESILRRLKKALKRSQNLKSLTFNTENYKYRNEKYRDLAVTASRIKTMSDFMLRAQMGTATLVRRPNPRESKIISIVIIVMFVLVLIAELVPAFLA